jgi:hypothetical protein
MRKAKAGEYLSDLSWTHDLSDAGGVLVVGSADRWEARRTRTPRAVLGSFLRTVAAEGVVSLDAQASFVAAGGSQAHWTPGRIMPRALAYGNDQGISRGLLMFYGSLSDVQRASLKGGDALGIASLTGPQRVRLDEMVYRASNSSIYARKVYSENPRTYAIDTSRADVLPHERYPTGLPGSLIVRMNVNSQSCVVGISNVSIAGRIDAISPATLAWSVARTENGPDRQYASWDKFLLGSNVEMPLLLEYEPNVSTTYQLSTILLNKPLKLLTRGELPEAFLKEFETALVKAREDFRKEKPTRPGDPPP